MSLFPFADIPKKNKATVRFALLGGLSVFALSGMLPQAAFALPGGEVIAGSTPVIVPGPAATFTRTGPPPAIGPVLPNALVVAQNAERVVIDWSNFDIASGESVTFRMGGANWIALNRVSGPLTNINGVLRSEIGAGGPIGGHVWIYNPSGMIFGGNARVDVGGLLATSAAPAIADFLGNPLQTSGLALGRGAQANASLATIAVNAGAVIQSPGGILSFLAPVVSQAGSVTATNPTGDVGQVLFGTGDNFRVGFAADPTSPGGWDLVSYEGSFLTRSGGFTHTGITRAGQVLAITPTNAAATTVNIGGLMEATSATVSPTGVVILSSGQAPSISNLVSAGSYDVGGSGQTNITIADNAIVSAGNIVVTGSNLNIGALRTTAGSINLFAVGGALNVNGALNASTAIRFETGGPNADIRINADLTAGERLSMYANRNLFLGNGVTPITLRSNATGTNAATDTLFEARGDITQATNAILASGAVGTPSGLIRVESIGDGRGTGINVGNITLASVLADSVTVSGNNITAQSSTTVNAALIGIYADRALIVDGIISGGDISLFSGLRSDGNLQINNSVIATRRLNSRGSQFDGHLFLQAGIASRLGANSDLSIFGSVLAEGRVTLWSLRDMRFGALAVINGDTDGNSPNTLFSNVFDDVEINSYRDLTAAPTSLIRSGGASLSGSIEIYAGAVGNIGSGGNGTFGRIEGRSIFVRSKRTDDLAAGGSLTFNGGLVATDTLTVWDDAPGSPQSALATALTFNAPITVGRAVSIDANYGSLSLNVPISGPSIRLTSREALVINQALNGQNIFAQSTGALTANAAITGNTITLNSGPGADLTVNGTITSTGSTTLASGQDMLVSEAANLDAPLIVGTASRNLTFNGTVSVGEIRLNSGLQTDGNLELNGSIAAVRRQNLAGTQFAGNIFALSGLQTRTGAPSDLIINGLLKSQGTMDLRSWRNIRLGASAFINGDSDGNSTNALFSPVQDVAIVSVRDIISDPTSVVRSGAGTLTGSIAIYTGAVTSPGYGGSGSFGRIEGGSIFVGSRLAQDLTRGGTLTFNGALTAIGSLLVIDDNSGAAQTGTPTTVSFNAPITVGRSVSIEANYGQLRLNVPINGPNIRLTSRDALILNQAIVGQSVSISSGNTITVGSSINAASVSLTSGSDLIINANISASASDIIARSGRDIIVNADMAALRGAINLTASRDIAAAANRQVQALSRIGVTSGRNISLDATSALIVNSTVQNQGAISLTTTPAQVVVGGSISTGSIQAFTLDVATARAADGTNLGNVAFNGAVSVTDTSNVSAGAILVNAPYRGRVINFEANSAQTGTIALNGTVSGIASAAAPNSVQLIAANDIAIGARVSADAVYINAGRVGAPRAIVIGGSGTPNDSTVGALTLTQAEIDQISASNLVIASRSASQGGGVATGNITVRDLALDGARVANLTLNTGLSSTIIVSGLVTQRTGSTAVNIGSSLTQRPTPPPLDGGLTSFVAASDPVSATTPGRVLVTGALGTRSNPIGSVNIRAYTDILFGTQAFVDLLTASPNTQSQAIPAALGGASPGQVWLSSTALTLGASGQIVMQNTGTRLLGEGLFTQAPANVQAQALVGAGPTGVPTRIDLYGNLLATGNAVSGSDVARVPGLLDGSLAQGVAYRFNGCVIPSGAGCNIISPLPTAPDTLGATSKIEPVIGVLVPPITSLQPEDDEDIASGGPVTGSGREEEWIKLPGEQTGTTPIGGAS